MSRNLSAAASAGGGGGGECKAYPGDGADGGIGQPPRGAHGAVQQRLLVQELEVARLRHDHLHPAPGPPPSCGPPGDAVANRGRSSTSNVWRRRQRQPFEEGVPASWARPRRHRTARSWRPAARSLLRGHRRRLPWAPPPCRSCSAQLQTAEGITAPSQSRSHVQPLARAAMYNSTSVGPAKHGT